MSLLRHCNGWSSFQWLRMPQAWQAKRFLGFIAGAGGGVSIAQGLNDLKKLLETKLPKKNIFQKSHQKQYVKN
jgi:hypothetical protein